MPRQPPVLTPIATSVAATLADGVLQDRVYWSAEGRMRFMSPDTQEGRRLVQRGAKPGDAGAVE